MLDGSMEIYVMTIECDLEFVNVDMRSDIKTDVKTADTTVVEVEEMYEKEYEIEVQMLDGSMEIYMMTIECDLSEFVEEDDVASPCGEMNVELRCGEIASDVCSDVKTENDLDQDTITTIPYDVGAEGVLTIDKYEDVQVIPFVPFQDALAGHLMYMYWCFRFDPGVGFVVGLIGLFALLAIGGVDCSYFCSSGSRLNSMVLARSAHDLKSRVRCDLNNQQTRLGIAATAHMPFDCFK
jgi:hypothetical protein